MTGHGYGKEHVDFQGIFCLPTSDGSNPHHIRHFDFIACGDNIYVTENHHVREGLTGRNIIWAFTTTDMTNWHPPT